MLHHSPTCRVPYWEERLRVASAIECSGGDCRCGGEAAEPGDVTAAMLLGCRF